MTTSSSCLEPEGNSHGVVVQEPTVYIESPLRLLAKRFADTRPTRVSSSLWRLLAEATWAEEPVSELHDLVTGAVVTTFEGQTQTIQGPVVRLVCSISNELRPENHPYQGSFLRLTCDWGPSRRKTEQLGPDGSGEWSIEFRTIQQSACVIMKAEYRMSGEEMPRLADSVFCHRYDPAYGIHAAITTLFSRFVSNSSGTRFKDKEAQLALGDEERA